MPTQQDVFTDVLRQGVTQPLAQAIQADAYLEARSHLRDGQIGSLRGTFRAFWVFSAALSDADRYA